MSGGGQMSYFDDSESLERHRQKWEKMHKRGAAFFILLVGVPIYGFLPFIVITYLDTFVRHEQFDSFYYAVYALFWILDGLFWGAVIWHVSEKRYMRAMQQRADPTQLH
jgi:hypothetical protein